MHYYLFGLCLSVVARFCSCICIHDSVQRETTVVSPPASVHHVSRLHARDAPLVSRLPLRVTPWYLPGESALITPTQSKKLQAAMKEVTRTVSSILSVRRVGGPLLLNRDTERFCHSIWRNSTLPNYNKCGSLDKSYRGETCLDVTIPDSHLRGFEVWPELGQEPSHVTSDGEGVPDTDFLLYVRVAQTERCAAQETYHANVIVSKTSVVAYASYCQLDHSGRPLAGVIVFCPEHLKEGEYQHSHVVQVSLHELLHALGFSRSLFAHWIDCSLYETGDTCSFRSKVANTDEYGHHRIYTPTVMQKMGEHLGAGPVGAPLENKDFPLSASSHWESRLLQGSILTASLSPPHLTHLDIITLAAFKDMGWYAVSTNTNDQLLWGKGAGLYFGLPSTCNDTSTGFFCTGSEIGCHHLHLDKGICSTDSFLDGCRIYKPLPSGGECWIKQENEEPGEIYGHQSRCFFSNLTKEVQLKTKVKGHCYLHRCLAPNSFQVKVQGSEWTDCPPGAWIQVAGFDGLILCPSERLCMGFDHLPTSTVSSTPVSTMVSKEGTIFPTEEGVAVRVQVTVGKGKQWSQDKTMILQEEVLGVIAQTAGMQRCSLHIIPQNNTDFSFIITARQSNDCPGQDAETDFHLAFLKLAHPDTTQITYNSPQFSTVLIRFLEYGCPTPQPTDVTNTPLIWGSLSALISVCLILIIAWRRHRTQSMRVRNQSQDVDIEGALPYHRQQDGGFAAHAV